MLMFVAGLCAGIIATTVGAALWIVYAAATERPDRTP